jgi:hypothetical protein
MDGHGQLEITSSSQHTTGVAASEHKIKLEANSLMDGIHKPSTSDGHMTSINNQSTNASTSANSALIKLEPSLTLSNNNSTNTNSNTNSQKAQATNANVQYLPSQLPFGNLYIQSMENSGLVLFILAQFIKKKN